MTEYRMKDCKLEKWEYSYNYIILDPMSISKLSGNFTQPLQ